MTEESDFGIEAMTLQGTSRDFEAVAKDWREDAKRNICEPGAFIHELTELIEGKNDGTPFPLDPRLRFREGEVTLWVGQNGSGKSMMTGQMASSFAMRGERTLICSFEMSPARTLFRMLRQAMGRYPTSKVETTMFTGRWMNWLHQTRKDKKPLIYLSNCRAGITPLAACGMGAYAAETYGCKHIIIDNLMKVVSGEDNYNEQKNFVADLTQLAQDFKCHVHLVHHVRKGNSESDSIDKFSVRGTSAITDLADNVLLLQRNFDKIKRIEKGILNAEDEAGEPDSFLRIAKQRNGDTQNALVKLWYHPDAACFCTDSSGALPVLCPDWVAGSSQSDRIDDCPF